MKQHYAVVLGMYGSNALGVVRALGKEKIPVAGIHMGERYPHAVHSKYVKDVGKTGGEEGLVQTLSLFGGWHLKNRGQKAVVFTTGDDYALFCERFKDELGEFYHLPLSSTHSLNDLVDKNTMSEIAWESGFHVPSTVPLSAVKAEEFNGNPVICRPTNSISTSKKDIRIYQTVPQLLADRDELLKQYGEMAVSTFVPGPITNHISVHMAAAEEPVIGMMLKKLNYASDPDIVISSAAESAWFEELEKPAFEFAKRTGFRGPIDFDLKRSDTDGKIYFLEANFRTSAINSLGTAAGRNIPAIMYHDCLRLPMKHLVTRRIVPGLRWVSEDKFNPKTFKPIGEIGSIVAWGFHDSDDRKPLEMMLQDGML